MVEYLREGPPEAVWELKLIFEKLKVEKSGEKL
jgi:hypothetical protein